MQSEQKEQKEMKEEKEEKKTLSRGIQEEDDGQTKDLSNLLDPPFLEDPAPVYDLPGDGVTEEERHLILALRARVEDLDCSAQERDDLTLIRFIREVVAAL